MAAQDLYRVERQDLLNFGPDTSWAATEAEAEEWVPHLLMRQLGASISLSSNRPRLAIYRASVTLDPAAVLDMRSDVPAGLRRLGIDPPEVVGENLHDIIRANRATAIERGFAWVVFPTSGKVDWYYVNGPALTADEVRVLHY